MDGGNRPTEGSLSWIALLLGVALGITGGLIYTWQIDPVIERNTAPWQLNQEAREDYVIAVALSYAYNRDLTLAFDRLRAVSPDRDVWGMMAEIACERHKRVQVRNNSDVLAMRALIQLYKSQGASGCADEPYNTPVPVTFATVTPTITPSPTLTPPATKTPTPPRPTNTPDETDLPPRTPSPTGRYVVGRLQSFCDPDAPGIIEVRVYDRNGQPVPGVPVQVTWGGSETQQFFTGLKPERELGYADFEMEPDRTYTVSVPDLVSEAPAVKAEPCEATVDGQDVTTQTSYWINFQQQIN
jgi:hypothetical protein